MLLIGGRVSQFLVTLITFIDACVCDVHLYEGATRCCCASVRIAHHKLASEV